MTTVEWTPAMKAHLLRLLTELPDTPDTFPETVPASRPNRAVADYFDGMQKSFLAKLDMDIPVREIRTQAGVFLDKLGTLSEALVLVVRAAQAAQRENITVTDLQERVLLRDENRTGRVTGKGTFAPLKRSRADAGLEATGEGTTGPAAPIGCTCGVLGSGTCPFADKPHFFVSRSTPRPTLSASASASTATGPRIDAFTFIAGSPCTADERKVVHELLVSQLPVPAGKEEGSSLLRVLLHVATRGGDCSTCATRTHSSAYRWVLPGGSRWLAG
jgi:hypothetical protein